MQKTKSPAEQGNNTNSGSMMLIAVKRLVKLILINVQGYITPNTYRIYDILFKLLNLREV